jgi:hypothetical protein
VLLRLHRKRCQIKFLEALHTIRHRKGFLHLPERPPHSQRSSSHNSCHRPAPHNAPSLPVLARHFVRSSDLTLHLGGAGTWSTPTRGLQQNTPRGFCRIRTSSSTLPMQIWSCGCPPCRSSIKHSSFNATREIIISSYIPRV